MGSLPGSSHGPLRAFGFAILELRANGGRSVSALLYLALPLNLVGSTASSVAYSFALLCSSPLVK